MELLSAQTQTILTRLCCGSSANTQLRRSCQQTSAIQNARKTSKDTTKRFKSTTMKRNWREGGCKHKTQRKIWYDQRVFEGL